MNGNQVIQRHAGIAPIVTPQSTAITDKVFSGRGYAFFLHRLYNGRDETGRNIWVGAEGLIGASPARIPRNCNSGSKNPINPGCLYFPRRRSNDSGNQLWISGRTETDIVWE